MAKKQQDETPQEVPQDVPQESSLQTQIDELTADLQRTRADFENYRKRVEAEKTAARNAGQAMTVQKLLPVIDLIDRAVTHTPADLQDNPWAVGIGKLPKQLESALDKLGVTRIDASTGAVFDPERHEAIQFDEAAEGETEVIAEELQAGYMLNGAPLRHAMVKVTRS